MIQIELDGALNEAMRGMRRKIEETFLVPASYLGMTYTNSIAEASAVSAESIMSAMRALPNLMPPRPQFRIVYSPYALEATEERLFPVSRNRSKRIHKKLVKRFGGEFRMRPRMWQFDDMIYAHPSFKARIEATFPLSPSSSDRTSNPVRAGTLHPYSK